MNRHAALVGLGYGDEGKGSIVDYLSSRHSPYGPGHFSTVVRFNGGAQAGHRVVMASALPDKHIGGGGGAHIFSQFGSGYFNGLMTHLSRHSLVDPLALVSEAEDLDRLWVGQAFRRLTIDRHALLVTPFHAAANKARERARGVERHGSCGVGIGETMAYFIKHPDDAPRVGDTQDKKVLRRKLWGLHDFYDGLVETQDMPPIDALLDIYHQFANWTKIVDEYYLPTLLNNSNVIFEGAQGVLLDEDMGFHPYTTWSKTTFANVIDLMADADDHEFERFGVTRTYSTRHGAGPFPVEDPEWSARMPDPTNVLGEWQGNFRVGPLDLVMLRYAAEAVGGLDQVAVTHMGPLPPSICVAYDIDEPTGHTRVASIMPPKVAKERGYQQRLAGMLARAKPVLEPLYDQVVDEVEKATGAPVTICGFGPKAENKQQRVEGILGKTASPKHEAVGDLIPA